MLMFGVVCKKIHIFRDSLIIISLIFTSFYVQGQPRLRIRNRDHPRTCFDTMNPMAVSESRNEFPLEITFFEVNSFVLREALILGIQCSILETRAYPWTRVDE